MRVPLGISNLFEADWQGQWLVASDVEIFSEVSPHLSNEMSARSLEGVSQFEKSIVGLMCSTGELAYRRSRNGCSINL
jgi:hypothetical protein